MKIFTIRWCPEAYGQWTLDSSNVGWWKSRMLHPFKCHLERPKPWLWKLAKRAHGSFCRIATFTRSLADIVLLVSRSYIYWHRRPTIRAVWHLAVGASLALLGTTSSTKLTLIESNSPSLLAVRQSRLRTYSRLFKLVVLAIDYYLLSFLQVLRFICSLPQALIRENAAATIKDHGFLKSCQASNNFRLCMTFLHTMLVLLTFQTVDYMCFFKSYLDHEFLVLPEISSNSIAFLRTDRK